MRRIRPLLGPASQESLDPSFGAVQEVLPRAQSWCRNQQLAVLSPTPIPFPTLSPPLPQDAPGRPHESIPGSPLLSRLPSPCSIPTDPGAHGHPAELVTHTPPMATAPARLRPRASAGTHTMAGREQLVLVL